ncbi:hypothetical protein TNCV_3889431 [Trichonephila clavipes]|nr:hypothetical protein TNCV_3889431 [Trichonephila clavipes]
MDAVNFLLQGSPPTWIRGRTRNLRCRRPATKQLRPRSASPVGSGRLSVACPLFKPRVGNWTLSGVNTFVNTFGENHCHGSHMIMRLVKHPLSTNLVLVLLVKGNHCNF